MKTKIIYNLPTWYDPDKYLVSEDGIINVGAQSEIHYKHSQEQSMKLDDWIVENIWDGDYEDYDAIGKRLAFLLDLRAENFERYRPMSAEKYLIYDLQNMHPEIYTAYRKYVTHE